MKNSTQKTLLAASALWIVGATAAWGYGGTIGPAEFVGIPKQATDYKNPLPVPHVPGHYHVTVCNDANWYGVWYPPEWKGNDGRVRGTPKENNQHGYAKEEDGTGGGVQIMGNGGGGNDKEITLQKENGQTLYLTIHVIDCSRHAGLRGLLAAAVPLPPLHDRGTVLPLNSLGDQLTANDGHIRIEPGPTMGEIYRASRQLGAGRNAPIAPSVHASVPGQKFDPTRDGCMTVTCAAHPATPIEGLKRKIQ
jgi:hypothetical protein